ncbi:hypothetical protein PUR_42960 [Paenibacillus sp. URB8-2]|nr:hypothetical protein PUR_42960 [Paenibacillus sp. URB8-2]
MGLSFFSTIAEELNCRFPNLKYDVLSEREEFIIDAIALNEVHLGIVPYTRGRTDLVSIPMYKEELVMLLPKKEDVMFTDSYTDWPRLLDITCFLFYMCSPIRKLTDPVLIQLLGEMRIW